MNTIFAKRRIHQYTWQHPGTKIWHCIDYVLMRHSQRRYCTDAMVFRSAECWTDHRLVCATLRLLPAFRRQTSCRRGRFNVGPLHDGEFVQKFVSRVTRLLGDVWDGEADGQTQWSVIRDCMLRTCNEMLGSDGGKQPNWFAAAQGSLRPLISRRNALFSRWLRSGRAVDRQRYLSQRRCVASAVRSSKNKWLQEKAQSIQVALVQGRPNVVWRDIRAIRECRAGIQPVRCCVIKKKNGEVCVGSEQTLYRWREHFEGVLNVIGSSNQAALEGVERLPLRSGLAGPPDKDEILRALGRLAVGRAGGLNGLLPDVLKCCGGPLLDYILTLFQTVWKERCVPAEWRDALLVPVPKKGDLSSCDNWKGISLLDVMGKLFARLLNDRLQLVVEETVSDSQCGFRTGRGCVDMIFCVRQLVEKAIEHNTKLFLLFVDLRKAYDSVPRAALWRALQKYGVPDIMIELIRSLHDGISATVTVGGGRSEPFSVWNGLHQGCTIAPTLFILYFGLVIDRWLDRYQAAGMEVQFKLGGRLVGERTKRPSSFVLSECLFADDAALVCSCREDVVLAARIFDEVATENGLTLSVPKTKLLVLDLDSLLMIWLHWNCMEVWWKWLNSLSIWDLWLRHVEEWLVRSAAGLLKHLGLLAVSVILCSLHLT